MRTKYNSYCFALLASVVGSLFVSSAHGSENERLWFSLVPIQDQKNQTNFVVLADNNHPQASGTELTNLLSNTNLFTARERAQIELLKLKYQHVTTNSGPVDTVFVKKALRQIRWGTYTNTFRAHFFSYTNSTALEEVASPGDIETYIWAKYRTPEGDGYNVIFYEGNIAAYQQFTAGKLNGLWVQFSDDGKIGRWQRFEQGKAVGQHLMWDRTGEIVERIVFESLYDLQKNAVGNLSMDWEECPKQDIKKGRR